MLLELDQQQKTIKQVHVEISAEVQRTNELKTKFGGAIADKYQEVVQHVQLLEQSQKLSKSRDRRGPLSPAGDKNIDRKSLFASMDSRGINKLSGHHSTVNLLDSGPKKESRPGSRSPTERDNPVSVRTTKGYSSSYTLLEKRRERADSKLSRGSRREDIVKGDEADSVNMRDSAKTPEKGENKELGSSPITESSVGAFEPNLSQPQGRTQGGSESNSSTQPRPQAGEVNSSTKARNQAESQTGGQDGVQGHVAPQGSQVGAQGSQSGAHGSQAREQGPQAGVHVSQAAVAGSNLGPQGQYGSQIGSMAGPTGSQPSGSHSLPASSIGSSLQGPPGLHLKSYGMHSETLQGSSLANTVGSHDNKQQTGSVQQGSGRLGSGRGGPIGKLQARGLSGGQMSPIQTPNTNNDNNLNGVEGNSYDFRSIALVQNELAARLAANHQLPSDLDATRDQMAALSRLSKGTKIEEADLSVVGVGVSTTGGDGYALPLEDKQQRMSFSLLRLAMQIRPEVYNRRRGGARLEDLKVAGQKLLS